MCPTCIAASTGGLTALATKEGPARIGVRSMDPTHHTAGDHDDSDE